MSTNGSHLRKFQRSIRRDGSQREGVIQVGYWYKHGQQKCRMGSKQRRGPKEGNNDLKVRKGIIRIKWF